MPASLVQPVIPITISDAPRAPARTRAYFEDAMRSQMQTLPWAGEVVPPQPEEPEQAFPLVARRREAARASAPSLTVIATPDGAPGRLRGDELLASIVFAPDPFRGGACPVDVGEECLDLLLASLPCRAAAVHLPDATRQGFLVACARGEGAADRLLAHHDAVDVLLTPASGEAVGEGHPLLVVPLVHEARVLGAIALAHPEGGAPFDADDVAAVAFLAHRYATFLARTTVELDEAYVTAKRPS